MKFTVGIPVRNRILFANEAITELINNSDYPIIVIDDNSDNPDGEYIIHDKVKVIYNKEKKGLTSLWNQILHESETEYVILIGDKLRLNHNDFNIIKTKLQEGFGLVATYMMGCFGMSKHLTNIIGLFDEGFKVGGYEDTDTMNKLFVNDIALYFSDETKYIGIPTNWGNGEQNKNYYNSKWVEDWNNRKLIQINEDVNINQKGIFSEFRNNGSEYLPWSKSELKLDNVKNYYNNLIGVKYEKRI